MDIGELAAECFSKERQKHLNAGRSVVETIEDDLYEVFPDGSKRFIKHLEPRVPVVKGTRIEIK